MAVIRRLMVCIVPMVLLVTTAAAETIDALKGKFTFDWHSRPDRQKCRAVSDKLVAEFKSPKFKCDLTIISNTASGQKAQVCEQAVKGSGRSREYLIFASMKSCEDERKTQASNGP